MGGIFQVFRGRVGIAIIGAILIGGVAAALGAGSVARPTSPTAGAVVQTAPTATTEANASPIPSSTVTAQPTPTDASTAVPTARSTQVSNTLSGTVASVDSGNHRFIVTRNGVQSTVLVDDVTTYGGIATQLTDLQPGWRVTITIAKREDNGVLARSVFASLDT